MALANTRKLLARLEARSQSLADSKPRRFDVGTAPDARQHSPPTTKDWKRIERAIALLRREERGKNHTGTPTRSLRDPEQTENIDIAGAIAFAAARPEVGMTPEALRRQLALYVYMYRNWPAFADQHHAAMLHLARALLSSTLNKHRGKPWVAKMAKARNRDALVTRLVAAAISEFMHPEACPECNGYGLEVTGVRVGQSCVKCGGNGHVQRSANKRARESRVRRRDWEPVWSKPYLALLDELNEFEQKGANLHAEALA